MKFNFLNINWRSFSSCCGVSAEPDGLAMVVMTYRAKQWSLDSYRVQDGVAANLFCRQDSSFSEREDAWRKCADGVAAVQGGLFLSLPAAMMTVEMALPISSHQTAKQMAEQVLHAEQQRLSMAMHDDWQYVRGQKHLFWAGASSAWLLAYQDLFSLTEWQLKSITPDICALFNAWLWCTPVTSGWHGLIDVSWSSVTLLVVCDTQLVAHYHATFGWQWCRSQNDISLFYHQLSFEIQTLYQFFLASHTSSLPITWHVSGVDESFIFNQDWLQAQTVHYWCAADYCRFSGSFVQTQQWQSDKHFLNRAIGAVLGSVHYA